MHLKETLTIKPDGFKIKVRPRTDNERGAFAGACAAPPRRSQRGRAPRARARPAHNTPLLVLYGSNLGTAEELAHARRRSRRGQRLCHARSAPLDDYAGKLPEEGGVLIFCASYNGAPPDNATQFVKWLGGDLPKDALARRQLRGVRLRQQRLGRDLSVDAAPDRRATGGAWRAQRLCRAARAMPAAISTASSRAGSQLLAPAAVQGIRRRLELHAAAPTTSRSTRSSRWRRSAVNTIVALGRRRADEGAGQFRAAEQDGANPSDRSTRHIEVQLPPASAYRVGDHLSVVPRNDPALVDRVARRFGFLPADQIRLQVAEGRRAQLPVGDAVSVGRLLTEFVELQQVATRKQIQIMSEHTRCPVTKPKLLAYVGDDAASAERYRTEVLAKRKSVFDLLEEHPACELPFHAYLEMLSLLAPRYYSISSSPSGDAGALQRHRRRGRRRRRVRAAASTRASARTISPAAAPATPFTPPCARPRPASACRTIPPCRSS